MFSVVLMQNEDLAGCTLIIPAVSVGNVGQLAVDLLVQNLNTIKIGYINSAYVDPVVGSEAYSRGTDDRNGKLCTACEIYKCTDQAVILVQQRAPIVSGCASQFRSELRKWIKQLGFQRVVLLASSFAHLRIDSQIANPTCRFVCTSVLSSLRSQLCDEFRWTELEEDVCSDSTAVAGLEARRNIPGGGITSCFLKECDDDGIPLVVLLKFCFEGDNVPDALEIVSYANTWLQLKKNNQDHFDSKWSFPESWLMLFGDSAPLCIF